MQGLTTHRLKPLYLLVTGMVALIMAVVIQIPLAATAKTAEAANPTATFTVSPETVDLGSIDYDSNTVPGGKQITLTDQSQRLWQNEQSYTCAPLNSNANSVFTVSPEAPTLTAGGQTTVTITPKAHVQKAPGMYTDTIGWVPQLDNHRVGSDVKVTYTIAKNKVNVISITSVSRYYGQSVNYEQTMVSTDKGSYSMAALGLTIPNNGADLSVGTNQATVTVNSNTGYEVTCNTSMTVTVNKATPELSNVKASNLTNGAKLSASTLTGAAINPWNHTLVQGAWQWVSPDEQAYCETGLTQTKYFKAKFVPTDKTNYLEQTVDVAVLIMSSGGPGGGGPSSGADPDLKVTGGVYTYDGAQHGAQISNLGTGNKIVTYTNKASGESTSNPPKNAGTYNVKVDLASTPNYNAVTKEATITISQRLANIKTTGDAIQSRPYNGETTAYVDKNKIMLDNVVRTDDVTLTMTGIKADYPSANVGNYTVTIQCLGASLSGTAAGNYKLNGALVTEKSTIFKRPARVDFKGGAIEKEYGQTFTFGAQGSNYTVETGTADTKSGVLSKDVNSINLTSAGAVANAAVGTYSISALGAGANYDLQVNGAGTLKVNKATPYLMNAAAGSGKIGAKLSSVPTPTVTYVNKNNGEAVPGKVTWSNPNQTIGTSTTAAGSTASYEYTFTPNSQANYNVVTGKVDITATTKTPVNITTTRTAFTYDGQPHEVSHTTSTAGATIKVTYKVGGNWVTTPPTAVGAYEFKIVADLPDSSEYADNELDGTMTISPLTPTGQPKVSGDGATLSAFKLDASTITGVGGKAVKGTIAWDNPSATVKAGDKYAWTFTSEDANYNNAKGTIIPKALANAEVVDKSKLQSALTNANTVLASAQVSSNGLEIEPSKQWVTNTVNDVLLKAIASANSCMTEGGATQKMVDEALSNLNTAVSSFRASMQAGLKGTDKEAVEKKASTIDIATNRYDVKPGDKPITISVGGEGNGAIFAFSDNDAVASAVASGTTVTVTPVSQGTAVVTVSRAATDTHEQASENIGIIVGEAPEGYIPPTEESVDTTPEVTPVAPEPTVRVYNPYSGEHLFVPQNEATALINSGWKFESNARTAEQSASNTPVYRLYNQWSHEHHYTTDKNEYDKLVAGGWTGEGVKFYSDDNKAVEVYRLFNPYEQTNTHHYTHSAQERDGLLAIGWRSEGVGWHYVSVDE